MRMSNDIGFGVLVLASSPGGGGSNVWTLMLGGDLNLSLCMTFFSKIAALCKFYKSDSLTFHFPSE